MAYAHGDGKFGLPVDQAKCIALVRESADLGFPPAQYQLGEYYMWGEMGLEQNEEEAIKYMKEAAAGGHLSSLHNLGCIPNVNGDVVAAMRYWRLSASAGSMRSMEALIGCFEDCLLHHADLAETLQAFCRSRGEMKSENRDEYIKYLKMTGDYDARYDF